MQTNRKEQILLNLTNLTYATANQLQITNNLKSNRNARRILYQMEQEGYIKSTVYKKKIYYISNKGSDYIGKGNTRLNKKEIDHVLMRNDLYIKLGMPKDWQKEAKLIVNDQVILISDARFKRADRFHFVEVDNKQAMNTNYEKIKRYKKISSMIWQQYKHHPTLIWYTHSDLRKKKLESSCKKAGIKYQIY